MPVKICHQPCSSRTNENGIPIARLVAVREEQIAVSIFQIMKPVTKITVQVSLGKRTESENLLAPQVANFLTSD
jgi:hypothetical protein